MKRSNHMTFTPRRGIMTAAVLGAAALLVAGCSSTPSSDAGSSSGASGGTQTITVAYNPAAQFAPMFIGMDAGIFAKHGLELNIVPQTDVASIVSGVASGQYDVGFATVVNVVVADANGIPIKVISTVDGQQTPTETDTQGNALVVAGNSGITDVKGLAGKTVAVVGLQGLNTVALQQLASNAGVDVSSLQLVQLPFGQMADALANGQVQAAVMQSPFIADALSKGGKVIAKPNVQLFSNAAVGVFVTSQNFIDSNSQAVQAFHDAEKESQAYAAAHVSDAQQTLVKYLQLTPDAAKAAVWCTTCNPDVNTKGLEIVQKALKQFAGTNDTTPVDQLVWPGALVASS
jgi:NitT/TauT family transport system substrate-binding protein